MTKLSYTLEAGLAEWRASHIDEEGFAERVDFYAETGLSAVDVIYAARVKDVNTSLDMAFFDLGNGQSGCMSLRRAKQLVKGKVASISDCLKEGQLITAQGITDASSIDGKAINLSAKPRLVGRYVVLELAKPRLFFSKDLPPRSLKALSPLLTDLANDYSIIVRTAAMDIAPESVLAEAQWLASAFSEIGTMKKPAVLFSMSPLEQALLHAPEDERPIYIENGSVLTEALALCEKRWPDMSGRLMNWQGDQSIAEEFGIEEAIEEALEDRIQLPSGGWITIEHTTALTVIDVNVGSALQGRPASEALLTVNMEAALASLYHMKFQDIGGLIVIDFVDMSAKGSAAQLINLIDETMKSDPVPIKRSGLSQFGLMEFSRKRKGLNLKDRMLQKRQAVLSPRAQAIHLIEEAVKAGLGKEAGDIILMVPNQTLKFLEDNPSLTKALADKCHRSVKLKQNDKAFVKIGS
ncbi:ribonuclease E/G [Temperatibacter marinus]|uniref:Ribonuclease E/G n=1 Tax=Temperatibacter marinus TaxID=1456591 RepID=A0AA52EJP5_9PROT|nr:ribonuclease E/G [Temperatibacter marinus]WND04045.1 ribonuclease E/G [Temperatibacter marinus]